MIRIEVVSWLHKDRRWGAIVHDTAPGFIISLLCICPASIKVAIFWETYSGHLQPSQDLIFDQIHIEERTLLQIELWRLWDGPLETISEYLVSALFWCYLGRGLGAAYARLILLAAEILTEIWQLANKSNECPNDRWFRWKLSTLEYKVSLVPWPILNLPCSTEPVNLPHVWSSSPCMARHQLLIKCHVSCGCPAFWCGAWWIFPSFSICVGSGPCMPCRYSVSFSRSAAPLHTIRVYASG